MVDRVIFDLDDTLLDTGTLYTRQLNRFADHVVESFPGDLTPDQVLERQQEIDQKAIEELGMAKERFPESLARTWQYYCRTFDRPVQRGEIERCLSIGWDVYEEIPSRLNGMDETLNDLEVDHELLLYTMGDPDVQREKIRHHSLEFWFSEIHIVPQKDRGTLRPLIGPRPPESTAVVGDSLRGEVKPALEMGLTAVHRRTDDQWHYHVVDVEASYETIEDLPEVVPILRD